MSSLNDELDAALRARSTAAARATTVTPQQVAGIADLTNAYPHLGGVAVPLALAGVPAASSVALKAATAKVSVDRARKVVGEETTGGAFSQFWKGTMGTLKSITRYAAAGASFPGEVVQGTTRAITGSITGDGEGLGVGAGGILRQTTIGAGIAEAHDQGKLGAALLDVVTPGSVDEEFSGSGFFIGPNTQTGQRQIREARATQLVDGRAGTVGRNVANLVGVEPGWWGHRVISGTTDLVWTLVTDPTGRLGKSAAVSNRARKVADSGKLVEVELPVRSAAAISADAGLVDGAPRKTYLPEKWASFLPSDEGRELTQALADIKPTDPEAFTKIWRGTNRKLPVDVVTQLVDATDQADVTNILAKNVLDGGGRELIRLRNKRRPPRLAGMMPATTVDLDDVEQTVVQAERVMRNVKMSEAEISTTLDKIARTGTKGERYTHINAILDSTKKALIKSGSTEAEATAYVKAFKDARDGNRLYHVDLIADGATVKSFRLGGTDIEIDGPHKSVQLIDRHMPLGDARELKNATRDHAWLRDVQANAGYKLSADALDFITQDMFKPLALLPRVAYPLRVLGEEQLRMGAAGYAAAFNHPLSYIALLIGDKPTVLTHGIDEVATAKRIEDARFAHMHDPTPENKVALRNALKNKVEVSEEVHSAIYQALAKHMDSPNLGGDALGGRFEDEDLVRGVSEWAQAMSKDSGGWADRVVTGKSRHWYAAQPHDPEFVPGWQHELIESASDPVIREIARNGPERTKALFWNDVQGLGKLRRELAGSLRDTKGRLVNFNDRAIADAYIDAEFDDLLKITASEPDLMKAVATGSLRGHSLTNGLQPGPQAKQVLDQLHALGKHPKVVRAQVADGGEGSPGHRMLQHWENTVQNMFRLMMSVPTNRLSRSKVFKQAYWNRMEETLPLMTKQEQFRLLRGAKEAGIPKVQIQRMRAATDRAEHYGQLTLEQADKLGKQHGLHETRDLLYSLHEKAQIADALRVVYPFGEAWREVLTRWAKLANPVTGNPNVLYRGQQGLNAAFDAGIFYVDPQTGQEMFAIPGSEWVTQKMLGVPMKLDMPVQGLNMFGTVLPGAGPAITYPASKFLPDTPNTDYVRKLILPFGDPDTDNGLIESFFPAYWKKLSAAAGHGSERSERQLRATVNDVAAYLLSTGDYDMSTPEGQEALERDAKDKGRALFVIRALAQGVAPSPPAARFSALDKTGALHTLYELQKDYRKMQAENFETATERFIEKWGELAFLGTVGKTKGDTAPTDRVNELARSHPEVASKHGAVFGLFAPGGTVDPGEIERQIQSGSRDIIGVKDAITTSNTRLALAQLEQAKAQVGDDPTAEERQWLWQVQDLLVEKYPGYTPDGFDSGKQPATVNALIRASKDKVLAATDAGQGLLVYLDARAEAQAAARDGGYKSFKTANAMQPWRDWLTQVADAILTEHPGFVDMWDRVLSREVGA